MINVNINKISEKILFIPKFKSNSVATYLDTGYVIRFIHDVHN